MEKSIVKPLIFMIHCDGINYAVEVEWPVCSSISNEDMDNWLQRMMHDRQVVQAEIAGSTPGWPKGFLNLGAVRYAKALYPKEV